MQTGQLLPHNSFPARFVRYGSTRITSNSRRQCSSRSQDPHALPRQSVQQSHDRGLQAELADGTEQVLALKEWAVTVAALGSGEQTILLRKGGIREPRFKLPTKNFLLFPNAFHSDPGLLKDEAVAEFAQELRRDPRTEASLDLCVAAEVSSVYQTGNVDAIRGLHELHIWSERFVDERLEWRKQLPLTVVELRVRRLPRPLRLPNSDEYWGCFSFVSIGAVPARTWREGETVLSEAEFGRRQDKLRSVMGSHGVAECRDWHGVA